jgi:cytochrome c oxidase subunit 2
MLRRLLFVVLLACATAGLPLSAADHAAPVTAPVPVAAGTAAAGTVAADAVAADVALFNPDIFSFNAAGDGPKFISKSAFSDPASDVAREVASVTWFSSLVFLPFLVLPLLLLVYVIFKFRDQGDGRQPATFTGNHTLEIVWTLIPCVALLIVSLPTWFILDWMEVPPEHKKDRMSVRVVGKQFAWDYKYLGQFKDPRAEEKQELAIGQFMGIQEPLILMKGRTVQLHMTSDDVNHAWWIPAFGVKKDCIKGRETYAWFTPDTTGVYKGQCAELCGDGHGIMLISSVVVEKPDFERFLALLRLKDDTIKVWSALQPAPGTAIDEKALREAVAAFLAKGRAPERQYALRYWLASNFATLGRVQPSKGISLGEVFGAAKGADSAQIAAAIAARRGRVDALLSELSASAASVPSPAAQEAAAIAVQPLAGAQP